MHINIYIPTYIHVQLFVCVGVHCLIKRSIYLPIFNITTTLKPKGLNKRHSLHLIQRLLVIIN